MPRHRQSITWNLEYRDGADRSLDTSSLLRIGFDSCELPERAIGDKSEFLPTLVGVTFLG
jgi:hypothetical protein